MGLFTTKSMSTLMAEASSDTEHGLKRVLGPLNLTTLGVGGIIGAGIFVLTGQAAAQHAGPAIVLSFLLAGAACAFAGLCYAEFASMIPIAGSAYTYAYATLGELFAWFIGWELVLEYAMGAATVAVGWSGYVVSFLRGFGIHLPPQIIGSPGTEYVFMSQEILNQAHLAIPVGWHAITTVASDLAQIGLRPDALQHATAIFNLPAMVIVGLVTALLVVGIQESATVNAIIVIIKVGIILVVIAVGFAFVKAGNWHPFIPKNTGTFGEFGLSGVLRGAGLIFFAFIGFDAVSTAAQEAKNPQRDMPIGILGSLIICTALYILVSLVLTGVVSYTKLAVPDPIAVVIDAMGIPWLAKVVKLGAIAGLSSVVLVLLLGQPRIFFSMSKDGLLPPLFAKLHPRFRTPYKTTIVTGIAVAVVAGLAPIGRLAQLVSIGTLSAFVIVCAGILVLRARHPELPRPFRTPGVPVVPLLGIGFCLYLMSGLAGSTWAALLIWLVIGMSIYFFYGRYHSVNGNNRPNPGNPGNPATLPLP